MPLEAKKGFFRRRNCAVFIHAFALLLLCGSVTSVQADEADARRLLKAMTDYMSAQAVLSFNYDATWEVVTVDDQILGIASSGSLTLSRPDKLHTTRQGGFADTEMFFDGKTLTLLGKNLNVYTQLEVPGTIDHLVNELTVTYRRPLPAADLLLSSAYEALMADVIDIKDLGSGVIGGQECDSLAFRNKEVDWQIWIAHGEQPYPCRYVITSRHAGNGLQYRVQVSEWKTGDAVSAVDYSFTNSGDAKEVALEDLQGLDGLPENFKTAKGDSE